MPVYKDESGRSAGPGALKVRGLALAAAVAIGGYGLYESGIGSYAQEFPLTLVTNTIGEGLAPGAEVKFHGFNIGQIKTLEATGYNQQRMTVILDGRQAKALTTDTTAQFTSSNIFGTAAVELVSKGQGEPLKPGGTLEIRSDIQAASITGFLRQGQKLGAILDTKQFNAIIATLERNADMTGPVVKSFLDLFKMVADAMTVPASQMLKEFASFIDGANEFVPVIDQANRLLDSLAFAIGPANVTRARDAVGSLSRFVTDIANGLRNNSAWLVPLIQSVIDMGLPAGYFFGSMAPAIDRVGGLLDRTTTAFPNVNGKVRLNLQLILDGAPPGLAAAVPPDAALAAAGEQPQPGNAANTAAGTGQEGR